eukprot:COSAG01_NODE_3541_length_5957_cov_20.029020_4_plen_153_part_00
MRPASRGWMRCSMTVGRPDGLLEHKVVASLPELRYLSVTNQAKKAMVVHDSTLFASYTRGQAAPQCSLVPISSPVPENKAEQGGLCSWRIFRRKGNALQALACIPYMVATSINTAQAVSATCVQGQAAKGGECQGEASPDRGISAAIGRRHY